MIRARAKIEPGHKIVLRYYGKHGLVEMTFERRVAELGKTAAFLICTKEQISDFRLRCSNGIFKSGYSRQSL